QPFCDLTALAGVAAQPHLDKDPSGVDPAMAIGKRHRSAVDHVAMPGPVQGCRRNEYVFDLCAVSARVHSQASADRAWDAGEEFQPRDTGSGRGGGDDAVERTRSDADLVACDGNASKRPP